MSKLKLNHFYLGDVPMNEGKPNSKMAKTIITHTKKPVAIIACRCLDEEAAHDDLMDVFDFYEYQNNLVLIETHQLILAHPRPIDDEDVPTYRKLLDKAWRWYHAYLQNEDDAMTEAIKDEDDARKN